MLGIEFVWSCPSCGNIIRSKHPFWSKRLRKTAVMDEPTRCGCGRKNNFKLVSFESCQFEIENTETKPETPVEEDKPEPVSSEPEKEVVAKEEEPTKE